MISGAFIAQVVKWATEVSDPLKAKASKKYGKFSVQKMRHVLEKVTL